MPILCFSLAWMVCLGRALPLSTSQLHTSSLMVTAASPFPSLVKEAVIGHDMAGAPSAAVRNSRAVFLFRSQTSRQLSTRLQARCLPSGEKATKVTDPLWSVDLRSSLPVAGSQSRTGQSGPPRNPRVASIFPSAEKARYRGISSCLSTGPFLRRGGGASANDRSVAWATATRRSSLPTAENLGTNMKSPWCSLFPKKPLLVRATSLL